MAAEFASSPTYWPAHAEGPCPFCGLPFATVMTVSPPVCPNCGHRPSDED